jgi:sugar lactone lactonase YvrE
VFSLAQFALASSFDFGSVVLGQNKSATVTLTFVKSENLGGIFFRTLGRENADFVSAGKGSCHTNEPYAAHATCTVKVSFQPQRVGMRKGAVVLTDSKGSPIATTYIHGLGAVANPTGRTDAKATVSGLNQPNGVAVDERGSIYVVTSAGSASNVLQEIPQSDGSFASVQVVKAAVPLRTLAIDDSHNLFVVGDGNAFYKETPTLSETYSESPIGTRLGTLCGIAVDGAGNLYISDCKFNVIYKETLSSSGSYDQSIVAAGLREPAGLAVDGDGVLYVAAMRDNKVYKETPSGDSYRESSINGPFTAPEGLALDAAGNLYVSDVTAHAVYKETPTLSGSYVQSTVFTDSGGNYIAIDVYGNLYVSDLSEGKVFRSSLSQ